MKFDIPADVTRRAKYPHELFLTNLVGNHILWFVAALGIFNTYWQPLLMVPIFSAAIIVYTLWRARQARSGEDWFVMCHWQIVARRSRIFALILMVGFTIAALGWVGYTYFGMMKVAVMAMVGGIGLLPVMVSVLVMIVMESDAMHQAGSGKLSDSVYQRFPNDQVVQLEEYDVENPLPVDTEQAASDTDTGTLKQPIEGPQPEADNAKAS